MKQIFLKSSIDLGWGSSDYRVGLGGQGETALAMTFGVDNAKIVCPINGTFSNLIVYSPAGTHPHYTVTLMVNGVASTIFVNLLASDTEAKDVVHSVDVVAGDDIYFSVAITPFGSGTGYPLNLAIEFEGAQQFYSITPIWGGQNAGTYNTGGALGNGFQQTLASTTSLSTSYSICATPGTLTSIRMKTFSGAPGTGIWTAALIKNQVLQDGTAGTVDTRCIMTGVFTQANNTFSLPIVPGDHLDFALLRSVTNCTTSLNNVAMSVTFNPTDPNSFMCCGGSNNANDGINTEYRWMASQQLNLIEGYAQCPITQRGLKINGLRAETAAPGLTRSSTYIIRKNGVDTAAVVTIADSATSGVISGLSIPFVEDDLINLKATYVNSPTIGNGMYWGLSMTFGSGPSVAANAGLYRVLPTKTFDELYDTDSTTIHNKIPDPSAIIYPAGD